MDGLFVIGADTNVGKTMLSAGLLKLLHGSRKVCYWKPIQTGTVLSDDTSDVKAFTEFPAECFMEPTYRFPEPLAPRHAAQKWNKQIDLEVITKQYRERADKSGFVIVEGAGGLMVPITDTETQRELIQKIGLPVIIAAEDRVGAINHTLLTIEACRKADIQIVGVVLSKAQGNLGNAESIAQFGKVEILAEIPHFEDARTVVAQVGAHPRLRQLLGVPAMPV
jgi:dethiobiotin synthase